MFSAVSWGPPSSEPNMLQINNSIRELLHKKEVVFCSFAGYLVFLVYTLFKPKYHSAGTGSMLRGVQRYGNDPDFLVYTLLKTK